MLNKQVKNLFESEKMARNIENFVENIYIDQLVRDDLGVEEKEDIAKRAKEHLADMGKYEEQNSEYWYKYGIIEGEIKGMWKAIGVFAVSYALGALLFRK
jgi:hypothetical protein